MSEKEVPENRKTIMRHIYATTLTAVSLLAASSTYAWDVKLGEKNLSFHGFASQGLLYSSDYNYLGKSTDGSFEFNEVGLNASISPFNRTRISVQAFMFDVGNVGNYNPFLDYASIEYVFNDYVGIRGGRVRRPGGIYNHIQDVDLARTSILLPQGMYDSRWRDFSTSIDGGVIFGNVPLSKAGSLAYEFYGGFMELSDDGGVVKLIKNGLPPAPIGSFDSIERNAVVGTQLWWNTPLDGLRAGVSLGYLFDFTYNFTVAPPFGAGAMRSENNIPYQQYSLEYLWKSWTFRPSTTLTARSTAPMLAVHCSAARTVIPILGMSVQPIASTNGSRQVRITPNITAMLTTATAPARQSLQTPIKKMSLCPSVSIRKIGGS